MFFVETGLDRLKIVGREKDRWFENRPRKSLELNRKIKDNINRISLLMCRVMENEQLRFWSNIAHIDDNIFINERKMDY